MRVSPFVGFLKLAWLQIGIDAWPICVLVIGIILRCTQHHIVGMIIQ
jgi:hypothetical protein